MLEAPNVPLTVVPAAVPLRVAKGVEEVPEVAVAAVHQLVGHHCQQEGEESKQEPDIGKQDQKVKVETKLDLTHRQWPSPPILSPPRQEGRV